MVRRIRRSAWIAALLLPSAALGQITISPPTLPNASLGLSYSEQLSYSPSGGTATWSIGGGGSLPPGLNLGSSSGLISGAASAAGTYSFTVALVVVGVTGTTRASKAYTIAVPQITTDSPLPAGTQGSAYPALTFAASDGAPPFVWSAPRPPAGLTLQSSGLFSGTPTQAGGYNFTVTATSGQGAIASKNFSITINGPLTIATSLPNGEVSVDYNQTLVATGGTPPYLFSLAPPTLFQNSALPSGLTLSSNGNLSGVPDTAGSFSFTVNVSDRDRAQASRSYTVVIAPLPSIPTLSPLPLAILGGSYVQGITATGGTPPYSFSVIAGALPQGLSLNGIGVLSGTPTAAGPFNFTVRVQDRFNVAATKQFQLTVSSAAQSLLVSPLQLQFSGKTGGDRLPPQTVLVFSRNNNAATTFTVALDSGAGAPAGSPPSIAEATPSWISVTPLKATSPARVIVTVDPGSMGAGTYTARIRLTSGSSMPLDVPVTLILAPGSPQAEVVPTLLRYGARISSPGNQEQTLLIRNSGGGGVLTFSAKLLGGASWVSGITPSSGQVTKDNPVLLRVRINTQGEAVGGLRDVIRISTNGGNIDVPVSLFVADRGPLLALNFSGVRFQTRQGTGTSSTQFIRVLNLGDPGTTVSWNAELLSGSDWLTLGAGRGTATPTQSGTLPLLTGPGAAKLSVGGHYALVRVNDPKALNSPQFIAAVIDVAAADTPPRPDPTPGALFFNGLVGGPVPSKKVQIDVSTDTPVAFQAASYTSDGGAWLAVSPTTDLTSTQNPGQLTVSINTSGLRQGVYLGEVDVAIGTELRTVGVTLALQVAASAPAPESSETRLAGCSPTQLSLTQSALVNHFSVPAGFPAALLVQLFDDCGAPVNDGSVVATFSNGDPPLSLTGDRQTGAYTATWQPGKVVSTMAISLQATSPVLPPVVAQFTGGVNPNSDAPPSLVIAGLLHNLNPLVGAPLAPGTVMQVYGDKMAQTPDGPSAVPLPTRFKGVELVVGGFSAPIYYISQNQLTVQLPNELAPNQQYSTILVVNDQLTVPQNIDLIPVQPGVVAFPDGRLVAQHLDFTLVDDKRPAKPGEVLVVYLVGMGATSPSVKSGDPAPSSPLATLTTQPTLTLDGQTVEIFFAGLTPGGVGLDQINFRVPANARSGQLPVIIRQGGQVSNTAMLAVQ